MYNTIKDACYAWVNEFNAIPLSAIEKLQEYDESVHEITPLHKYDRVVVYDDEWAGEHGEIVKTCCDKEPDLYAVKLDSDPDNYVVVSEDCLEKEGRFDESIFPMWPTMWSFGDKIDEDWLLGEFGESHLQEVADIGFRIYESEDFGILLGIDTAGFDFYEAFWIPLYKLRGLKWHKEAS